MTIYRRDDILTFTRNGVGDTEIYTLPNNPVPASNITTKKQKIIPFYQEWDETMKALKSD